MIWPWVHSPENKENEGGERGLSRFKVNIGLESVLFEGGNQKRILGRVLSEASWRSLFEYLRITEKEKRSYLRGGRRSSKPLANSELWFNWSCPLPRSGGLVTTLLSGRWMRLKIFHTRSRPSYSYWSYSLLTRRIPLLAARTTLGQSGRWKESTYPMKWNPLPACPFPL